MENYSPAGLGKRFLAFIIDIFVVIIGSFLLCFILLQPFGGFSGATGLDDFQFGEDLVKGAFLGISIFLVFLIIFVGIFVFGFFYEIFMLSSSKQATLGKAIMNIKVVSLNGNSLSFLEALFRTLIKYFTGNIFIFLWLICLFNDKRQNLHDLAIKGWVVESN